MYWHLQMPTLMSSAFMQHALPPLTKARRLLLRHCRACCTLSRHSLQCNGSYLQQQVKPSAQLDTVHQYQRSSAKRPNQGSSATGLVACVCPIACHTQQALVRLVGPHLPVVAALILVPAASTVPMPKAVWRAWLRLPAAAGIIRLDVAFMLLGSGRIADPLVLTTS